MITAVVSMTLALLGFGALTHKVVSRVRLHAISVSKVPPGEVEINLSDGRVYRWRGFDDWVKFPDGTDAGRSFGEWLTKEMTRLHNIEKWSQ